MMLLDHEPGDDLAGISRCQTCGRYVSDSFARVFGDNNDTVHGCPACTTFRERSVGGATDDGEQGAPPDWGAH